MNQYNNTKQPVIEKLYQDMNVNECGYVKGISWSQGRLDIQVVFDSKIVQIIFEEVSSFRVLDEGDLTELWNNIKDKGFIYKVTAGGWKSLESTRVSFLKNYTEYVEYLIAGTDECVSVLSRSEPIVI